MSFLLSFRVSVHNFRPLFYNAVLRLDAPLSFAGGLLHELYEGSGVTSVIDNLRSILCSSSSGKMLHTIVRPWVFNVAEHLLSGIQVGGRLKCGVDVAFHIFQSSSSTFSLASYLGYVLHRYQCCFLFGATTASV